MGFLKDQDLAVLALLAGIGVVLSVVLLVVSIRHFPLAIFLVALAPFFSSLFLPNSDAVIAETPGSFVRLLLIALMGVAGGIVAFRIHQTTREPVPIPLKLLGLFLAYALVSTVYSLNWEYTAIRAGSFLTFYFFLLGLYFWIRSEAHFEAALGAILTMVLLCLLLCAFSFFVWPSHVWLYSAPSRFQGLWGHPNNLGLFCMLSYPLLLWKFSRSTSFARWVIGIALVMAGGMHLLSGSRTSLFAACIGLLIWFALTRQFGKLIYGVVVAMMLAITLAIWTPASFEPSGNADLADLTGRNETWRLALQYSFRKPLLGYGYDVDGEMMKGDRNPIIAQKQLPGVRISLHNGYLNTFSGLGAVGLLLWLAIVLFGLWRSWLLPASDYRALFVATMVMGLVVNQTETSITGGRTLLGVFFWLSWTLALRAYELSVAESEEPEGLSAASLPEPL